MTTTSETTPAPATPMGAPHTDRAPTLTLAPTLSLPLDVVTETMAIFSRRGSGKTTTAAIIVEGLLPAGAQAVVIDPLDAWWGLRLAADGQSPGLPIVVLGGAHGDLPLEAFAGAAIADAVVDERLSVVLSLRHLSKTGQRQLVTAFCERLYERKGPEEYRTPLCLVIDEADLFAPQRVYAGQERLLGAIDDIARRGRMSGLGLIPISQRPAVVNADVRSQAEILVVGRLMLAHDQKAIAEWVEEHATPVQKRELLSSLPSLPIGTFWVCSPGWLHVFERVEVRQRRTFDSSSTPTIGAARPAVVSLAPLLAHVGDQPVSALTHAVASAYLAAHEHLAASTFNRRYAALRSFARWCKTQGWLHDDPLIGLERRPHTRRGPRALDPEHVEARLRTIHDTRDRALFWLIYDGALRCREALTIDVDDIDWTELTGRSGASASTARATVRARCSSPAVCRGTSTPT